METPIASHLLKQALGFFFFMLSLLSLLLAVLSFCLSERWLLRWFGWSGGLRHLDHRLFSCFCQLSFWIVPSFASLNHSRVGSSILVSSWWKLIIREDFSTIQAQISPNVLVHSSWEGLPNVRTNKVIAWFSSNSLSNNLKVAQLTISRPIKNRNFVSFSVEFLDIWVQEIFLVKADGSITSRVIDRKEILGSFFSSISHLLGLNDIKIEIMLAGVWVLLSWWSLLILWSRQLLMDLSLLKPLVQKFIQLSVTLWLILWCIKFFFQLSLLKPFVQKSVQFGIALRGVLGWGRLCEGSGIGWVGKGCLVLRLSMSQGLLLLVWLLSGKILLSLLRLVFELGLGLLWFLSSLGMSFLLLWLVMMMVLVVVLGVMLCHWDSLFACLILLSIVVSFVMMVLFRVVRPMVMIVVSVVVVVRMVSFQFTSCTFLVVDSVS